MGSAIVEINIDCTDVERVAGFWGEVLGWRVQQEGELRWMSATGNPGDGLMLVFAPVPERKTVKNRLHIDLGPSGCDQPEELARLLSLGASHVDVGQGDVPWIVLADPEGNEFCLLARRVG
jgi:predicted enzyme related to lactoylglutathione lyase